MFLPLHDENPLRIVPFQVVTVLLIAACTLAFLWQLSLSEAEVLSIHLRFGAIPAVVVGAAQLPTEYVQVPGVVTMVSSMFLHGSWMHLIGNMLFLWVFGDNVEDAMGHVRFIFFYFTCGIVATAIHVLSEPASTSPMVGASGAVAGVLGAYLTLHPRVKVLVLVFNRIPVRLPAYLLLGIWLGTQITYAFIGNNPGVAWWAHIGGFAAGVALIAPLRYKNVPLLDRGTRH